ANFMTLAEIISEVYTITGRPDRVAETLSAVKAATLFAHQTDYYYKDLFESGLKFDTAEYIQSLNYRDIIPRWRAVKYMRKFTPANPDVSLTIGVPGPELTLINPDNLFDAYLVQKTDVF